MRHRAVAYTRLLCRALFHALAPPPQHNRADFTSRGKPARNYNEDDRAEAEDEEAAASDDVEPVRSRGKKRAVSSSAATKKKRERKASSGSPMPLKAGRSARSARVPAPVVPKRFLTLAEADDLLTAHAALPALAPKAAAAADRTLTAEVLSLQSALASAAARAIKPWSVDSNGRLPATAGGRATTVSAVRGGEMVGEPASWSPARL